MNDCAWVATRKGLFMLRRHRGSWSVDRVSFLGEPVSMVLPPQQDGRMLAALNLGHFGVKVHASDDAGVTWVEVGTPTYPPQSEAPAAAAAMTPGTKPDVPWKLVQIWSLEATPGILWAGTLPGGLFRSQDGGVSWQLVESLWNRSERTGWFGGGYDVPGIHSICPHPMRPDELLVGVSCGGAWVTRDGGQTWQLQATGMRAAFMPPELADDPNTQDPHRIVRCTAQPEVLWCQHHCGIWRSTDNAASWQQVSGEGCGLSAPVSTFGFAVAVHPQQPDTAWFAPAVSDQCRVPIDGALMVQRTRDGGRSFETLRAGLPQRDCYDLIYRHGLAVADDGTSLLMGSSTGSLWGSVNGGDTWAAVSLNLPPIYAVRFG